eukprot:TRINITY_DN4170_c0_g1_i1.p1 TRINITY_DN4170_c0_g1~~TRINITY_DN4170_c0_g1_i1.p1  ORF type:complete len:622 (-),score=80.75 TRINITY_DN4170_c0_g1_i1:295-2160(-)
MYPSQYTSQYDYGTQQQPSYEAYGWSADYAGFEESNGAYHVYYHHHHRDGPVYFDQIPQTQALPLQHQQQPPHQHHPHHTHQHHPKHRNPHSNNHHRQRDHHNHNHNHGHGHSHHGQSFHTHNHQQQQQHKALLEPILPQQSLLEVEATAPVPRVYSEDILKTLQNRGRNPARTVIASDVYVAWGTYPFSSPTNTPANGSTPAETPAVKKHWQKPSPGAAGFTANKQVNGRGNGGRRDPSAVCLDYLKGVCNDKRYKCKYVHPPMPLGPTLVEAPIGGDTVEQKQEVCDVWILTGFCKFGEKCRFYHPVLDESSAPMCSPAFTAKMAPPRPTKGSKKPRHDGAARGQESFEAALVDSSDESSDTNTEEKTPVASRTVSPALSPTKSLSEDTPLTSPLSPLGLGLDATVRKINGILNRITAEKFASLSQQLLEMVNQSDTCLMRALPLVFAKGCAEEKHGEIYAQLCKTLYNGASTSQRHTISSTLLQLGSRLLHNVDDLVVALAGQEEQLFKLQLKRIGNIRFLGELFLEELLHLNSVLEIVTFLENKSFRNSDKADAALHIELLCKFLSTVGERVDTLWPGAFDIYYRNLQHAAARHATRVQVLIQNLCEWRHVHCWARV